MLGKVLINVFSTKKDLFFTRVRGFYRVLEVVRIQFGTVDIILGFS